MKNKFHRNPALILTAIRFALIPIIVVLIFSASWRMALGLFGSAALTDWLDGLIARTYNCETMLGAALDPLADKSLILMVCTSVWYTLPGMLPGWFVLALWFKELLLMCGFMIIFTVQSGCPAVPSYLGKAAMALEVVLVCVILISLAFFGPCAWVYRYTQWMMWLILGVTIAAGYDYMARVRKEYG